MSKKKINLSNSSPLIVCSLFRGIKIFGRVGGGAKNDSWYRVLIMLCTALTQIVNFFIPSSYFVIIHEMS